MFGLEKVMVSPEKGSFPLLGLEDKRVVLLDEWRFNTGILPLATQLLWLEGKPLLLAQPQNTGSTGHVLYSGSAPIFITTKAKYLDKLVHEAREAEAADENSVFA